MRGEIIHQIYIADGFDDDCDALVHRCLRTEKLNYQTFCEIWKDMKFDSIYVGRSSAVEIAELSEELVHIAKQFMMANVSNFEETVAGLFLVYSLLTVQPYSNFAVLRLVPSDVPTIKRIETIARRDRRRDVLYILGAVLIKHSQFHAEQRERGMELVYRKYLNGYIGIDRSGFRPRSTFYRQTEELDLVRELAALTDRYETAKSAIKGGKANQSLSFINKKLPSELDASLKRLISGIPGMDDDDDIDESDVHYSKVQAIKERAMKKAVGSMKHLTSAAERSSETSAPKIVSEIKSKPGKVKTSSLTKAFLSPKKGDETKSKTSRSQYFMSPKSLAGKTETNTKEPTEVDASPKRSLVAKASTSKPPLKRKKPRPRKKTKKSKVYVSESSSDSDLDLSELDHGNTDDELDLDTSKPTEDVNETNRTMVDIEIDNLPSRITTEGDGKVYEIEIIDKFDKSNVANEVQDVEGEEKSTSTEIFKKPKGKSRIKKPTISLSRLGIMPGSEGTAVNTRQMRRRRKE